MLPVTPTTVSLWRRLRKARCLEINNNLQRVRDLTVQAQNSSNSASDIDSIQSEVNQRMAEIDRVTKETDFNGIKILNNDSAKDFAFQVGSRDGEKISITMDSSAGWNLYEKDSVKAPADKDNVQTGELALVNGEARKVNADGFDVRAAVTAATAGTPETMVQMVLLVPVTT